MNKSNNVLELVKPVKMYAVKDGIETIKLFESEIRAKAFAFDKYDNSDSYDPVFYVEEIEVVVGQEGLEE